MSLRFLSYVLGLQGLYYFVTGLWPVVEMPSFIVLTGPKTDLWLVRTVGGILTICGISMMLAAAMRRISIEIGVLALGLAFTLALVDIVAVLEGVASPVYLADAVVELALLGFWYYGYRMRGEEDVDAERDEDRPYSGEPMVH